MENNEIKEIKEVTDTQDGANSTPAVEMTEIVGINFRPAGKIYYFAPAKYKLKVGQRVIVETSRGVESGTVKIANKSVPTSEIVAPLRPITRPATQDDLDRIRANHALEKDAMVICKKKIAEHRLEMHLVEAEYTFDNSKLTFYFTSEGRVDFRELVKDLANVFKTRIELRQIGIRDEAKMMGGLGSCGKPFCCSEFLSDFVQVSIKMAKEQNFSLNSAKISGSCGRLMCCLRYEHEAYENALLTTPPQGSYVATPSGEGTVIETRPLLQLVKVRMNDDAKNDTIKLFPCEDVKVISKRPPSPEERQKRAEAEKAERAEKEKAASAETVQKEENTQNQPKGDRPEHRRRRHNRGKKPQQGKKE